MLPEIGVYAIRNKKDGSLYVGSSSTLRRRRNAHWRMLKQSRHDNIHLQRAWNRDGESSFVFEVLEEPPYKDMLCVYEQIWINRFISQGISLYNILILAGKPPSPRGRPILAKTRRKLSEAHQNRDQEYLDKLSAAHAQEWIVVAPDGQCSLIKSLVRFCRVNELERSAMLGVVSGLASHHKGWRCMKPTTENMRLTQNGTARLESFNGRYTGTYEVTSPDGKTFVVESLSSFCKEHDLGVAAPRGLRKVAQGLRYAYKGWVCRYAEFHHQEIPRKQCKYRHGFEVTSPDGNVFITKNLEQFSRERHLSTKDMHAVARSEKSHHKGWKVNRLIS